MGAGLEFPRGDRSWVSRSVNSLQICLKVKSQNENRYGYMTDSDSLGLEKEILITDKQLQAMTLDPLTGNG